MEAFRILLVLSFCVIYCHADCATPKHTEADAFNRLKSLNGNRYSVSDTINEYTYTVAICTDAVPKNDKMKGAGVVQQEVGDSNRQFNVGSYLQAEFMEGTDWVMVEYEGGDSYGHSCSQESRRSIIMVTCDPGNSEGILRLVEENKNKTGDCYYLFELDHESVCKPDATTPVSIGTVFCVVFFVVILVYVVVGLIYKRCVTKAKGLEQIPNYTFWRDFGNLQADGCDLVCRCGSRTGQVHQYEPVGAADEQLGRHGGIDTDERLLPM